MIKLWELIEATKENGDQMNIASIDIKGAYDGVAHDYLLEKLEYWRKRGYYDK